MPGRHAADGGGRGGVWPRGGTYRSARCPLQQRPRHRPSRKRARASSAVADATACSSPDAGAGVRSPVVREAGSEKVDTPPKGPRIYPGRPGITYCHSRKNARAACLRAGDVARPLALPPKLFPNGPHSCEYATKEGDRAPLQGRCSANVHLSEGPGRHRSCCYVHARLWRIWSPACEELSRLLASQFGWVRPVRSAQGAAREGEGC